MAYKTFFVSCFEASGDAIGAHLVRALRVQYGDQTRFVGVAGPLMQAENVLPWTNFDSLNVMGIIPVLKAAPRLLKLVRTLAAKIDELNPDGIITIDAPDFHIRLMRKMRRHDCPRMQMVSPSVWAWRAGRAKHFAQAFDVMYCVFPFEPKCYARLPVSARYLGHPSVTMAGADKISEAEYRQRFDDKQQVALLFGSRKGELLRLKDDFLSIKQKLEAKRLDVQFVIPTLSLHKSMMQSWFADHDNVTIVTDPDWRFAAMRYSNAALCCMGTAELELSLRDCPHVAIYRFKGMDNLLRRLFTFSIQHGALSNILLNKEAFPEYIQHDINHEDISNKILNLLDNNSADYDQQKQDMQSIQMKLSSPNGNFATAITTDISTMIAVA